jgi:GR25 family glycosyltransferase involved in LPS biosynthesis
MKSKIFVINLKKREDRKTNIIHLFKEVGIEDNKYFFYEGINGKNIPLTLEIKNLFQGNDFGNRKGFIGCALSHYNLWLDLVEDEENDFYLIFEDDIELSTFFNENYNKCLEYIKNSYTDFLLLGYHRLKKIEKKDRIEKIDISIDDFNNNEYVGGFFSYIITKKGAKNILNYIQMNGIKHGIDYLLKIDNSLVIKEVNPNIVFSEWVRSVKDDTDSNIQKDFEQFDFNNIYDYNNFLYLLNYDQINNDYAYLNGDQNINNLLEIAKKDDINIAGFNTLGFIKYKIDLNEIKRIDSFNNNHGLFINLNKKINVKMICDWCNSKQLCNEWNNMSKGDFTWNNIRIRDNDFNIDYYVIINRPSNNEEKYIENKTIVFQMEPRCNNDYQKWGVKTWGEWADPDETKFLEVRNHKNYYNNCMWQLNSTYNDFMETPIEKKYNYLSTICSSKYYDPGHIKRVDFLKYLEENNVNQCFKIDIYGNENKHNFKNYIKALDIDKKNDGIIPYKYYFMAENNREHNYITEKLWEPIISECLCFYWGAPNLSDYIDNRAYISLNLDDFVESFEIIKNAIENDLWSERIDIIRKEKFKILNYYNFFPTIERIITKDLLKDKMNQIISSTKICIFQKKENELNYKIIPFIYNLKEIGLTVDIYVNFSNNDIINDKFDHFLIIEDTFQFISSLQNLINHILYLPLNYDICLLNHNYKIVNQYNSFYYFLKRCYVNNSLSYIISKRGLEKKNNLNIYGTNGNQLFIKK